MANSILLGIDADDAPRTQIKPQRTPQNPKTPLILNKLYISVNIIVISLIHQNMCLNLQNP